MQGQPVLLPELTELFAVIAVAFVFQESLTSTYETLRVPCGSIFHWSAVLLRRSIKLPATPVKVKVPLMV